MRIFANTVSLFLGLLIAAPAMAQPESSPNAEQAMQGGGMTDERQLDDARAREHYIIGTRYYDEGRFVEAATQFEEAFQLSGRPELQYNAYIAYRDAHQARRAAQMLRGYLEAVADAPDRVNLEARLAELERAIALEEEQSQQLTEAQRRAQEEAQRAAEEAAARRQAEAEPEVWPWVILGVGGAAAIAGAVVGGLALSDAMALRADCDQDGRCVPSTNLVARRSDATNLAVASDLLLFGGGAVAVTGLILGLVFGLGGSAEEAPAASAFCTSDGCHATLRGTF